MHRRLTRIVGAAGLSLAVLLASGIGMGLVAAGPSAPGMTDLEREVVINQARMDVWDNPGTRLKQLSYRVDRLPGGPASEDCVDPYNRFPRTATRWRVTAFTMFGAVAGRAIVLCIDSASVEA